jgi:hypothetical protein
MNGDARSVVALVAVAVFFLGSCSESPDNSVADNDNALMVHAEVVADSSGASDYSDLAIAGWPNETFRSSGPICLHIPPGEVEGEHDLQWLRQNGFEPSGNTLYAQYFATTADMNAEVVISILQHVGSCDDEANNPSAIGEFQAKASVSRIE